jgi:hypothetical protein
MNREEIRETLAKASADALRVIAEELAVQLAEQRVAGRKLIDAHRVALALLRIGRTSDATKICARAVATSGIALAEQAMADAGSPLADLPKAHSPERSPSTSAS